jgi:hypothetical protein
MHPASSAVDAPARATHVVTARFRSPEVDGPTALWGGRRTKGDAPVVLNARTPRALVVLLRCRRGENKAGTVVTARCLGAGEEAFGQAGGCVYDQAIVRSGWACVRACLPASCGHLAGPLGSCRAGGSGCSRVRLWWSGCAQRVC